MIFSNELVDAFPVTLLQQHEGIWKEVWLEVLSESHEVVETLRPVRVPEFSLQAADYSEGQRVEVHASWRHWLETWRPHWKAGGMLTIDYGDTSERLYYRRPKGTLRGYQNHQRLEGLALYQKMGQLDLTADVNFTDLMEWGHRIGLRTLALQNQAGFLLGLEKQSPNDGRLMDSSGAGGAFFCLEQSIAAEPGQ